jgi:acyl-CoA thioester hydrolase
MPVSQIYTKIFIIPESSIDENGHVNNVAYVQWMQDVAVEHYASIGGIQAQGPDTTLGVLGLSIEYFLPAYVGEGVDGRAWGENVERVRSLRKYEFIRRSDGKTLVKGETDWVFVDVKSGRPLAIPDEVKNVFSNSD